jgi:hypothetical protein
MGVIGLLRLAMMAGAITLSVAATAATPKLSPAIPGRMVILRDNFKAVPAGYVTEEHFLSGTARSWRFVNGASPPQGAIEPADEAPFTTRLIVVRPTDPKRFNGTVLVEWLNVSGGADGAPEWTWLHREMIRKGYAYVAVSAQRVAIDGTGWAMMKLPPLKQVDPVRYAALAHPRPARWSAARPRHCSARCSPSGCSPRASPNRPDCSSPMSIRSTRSHASSTAI